MVNNRQQQKALSIPPARPVHRVTAEQHAKAKGDLELLLRDRFIRSFFGMPDHDELIDGNNYVVGSDGLYMVRKNRIGLFTTSIAKTEGMKIPLVDNGKQPVEGFTMTLENKIPHNFLLQTVAFFKKVYEEKKGAEAVVQIFYNTEDKRYFFNIDTQGVSGGSARMDRDAELETNHLLVADIHSHNQMGAFFSSTDNGDEKEARVYGVMGRVNTPWPEMKFRAGDGKGSWIELHMFEVFETPEVNVDVPNEWMDKVHDPVEYRSKSAYYNQPMHHIDNSVYDRYVPPKRRGRPGVFGGVGTPNQDDYVYPIEEWMQDIGWQGEADEELCNYLHASDMEDIGPAIESLIVNSEILEDDEAKAMWLGLFGQLDAPSREIVRKAIDESFLCGST